LKSDREAQQVSEDSPQNTVNVNENHAQLGSDIATVGLQQKLNHSSISDHRETALPESWVKAAMLIRCNSLATGNSGVSVKLLEGLVKFIQSELVPIVPVRGSVSASGDLTPLAYVAGALAGSPSVRVWSGKGISRVPKDSDKALIDASLMPIKFGPKEVISMVNGTAFSAGAGALALHHAHGFAILTDIITAMSVEALRGTAESFSEFFGQVRPHTGQIESSKNIRYCLKGSLMLPGVKWDGWVLRQDRYSTRTASQWIGPCLEELLQCHTQIITECNSTTDNPLVDASNGHILHGGNFQAMAVTSAMEKVRSSLQIFGRMIFSQITEIINPTLNNGLPSNLTVDEPSLDYLMKGVDVHMAAYTSELGYLAGRMTPHTMSAEMHNQAINSLALLSTRYTFDAIETFTALVSTALVALCQALDIRAINQWFFTKYESQFSTEVSPLVDLLWQENLPSVEKDSITKALWIQFQVCLAQAGNLDTEPRFEAAVGGVLGKAYTLASKLSQPSERVDSTYQIHDTLRVLAKSSRLCWLSVRDAHSPKNTFQLLGSGSRELYRFIRQDLGIPLLRNIPSDDFQGPFFQGTLAQDNIGTFITRVAVAVRDGRLFVPVMSVLRRSLNDKGD
jgi:phenylalanine ammonia-lyase